MNFPGCQLAEEYTTFPDTLTAVEPKLDGYRLSIVFPLDESEPTVHCRKATAPSWAENVQHIVSDLYTSKLFRGCMLDGEVSARSWGRTSQLLRRKRSGMGAETIQALESEVWFEAFDMVDLTATMSVRKLAPRSRALQPVYDTPLVRRRAALEATLSRFVSTVPDARVRLVPQFRVQTEGEFHALFAEFVELGFEGAMIKDLSAPYAFTRSPFWLKCKPFKTIDLKIVGSVEGMGKHTGRLGALQCLSDQGVSIDVGGGFTDAQRESIWAARDLIGGLRIEVRVQDDNVATARHPVFIRFRDDTNAMTLGIV